MLSQSNEDYLKTIWQISEWDDTEAAPSEIARRMGLSASTVSEGVKKLDALGLVHHARYGSVRLTERGRAIALNIVRKHRLIETFLHDTLGYSWDELHEEAEALEHAVSDRFIDSIDELLGHPLEDPHGDSIPAADGALPHTEASSLGTISAPANVTVVRVADDDPSVLVYLGDLAITPGTQMRLIGHRNSIGLIDVIVNDREIALPEPAAAKIWIRQS